MSESNKRGRKAILTYEERRTNLLASKKKYRDNNKEKVAEKKKEWNVKNRDHIRQYNLEWYYKNSVNSTIGKLEMRLSQLQEMKRSLEIQD